VSSFFVEIFINLICKQGMYQKLNHTKNAHLKILAQKVIVMF